MKAAYLHKVTFVPRLQPRPHLFLVARFRLLRVISRYYPNKIAFWLLNSNKCMLALWDIMLGGGKGEREVA